MFFVFHAQESSPSFTRESTFLVKSRALAFKAKESSDYSMKQEACTLHNRARAALKKFRHDQMIKTLESRHETMGGNGGCYCQPLPTTFR
jgi:hypothetical protein